MKYLIFLVIFFQSVTATSQQILNPSFEIKQIPEPDWEYFHDLDRCDHWEIATYSSDWLSPEVGTSTWPSYQPRTGTGHAGFGGKADPAVYKKMIRGKATGLVAGTTYNVSFWVRRSGGSVPVNVGACLSTNIPVIHDDYPAPYVQNFTPQISGMVPGGNDDYMKISGCFTPTQSGLHYIVIGVFEIYPEVTGNETNYFNIDDVNIEVSTGASPNGSIDLASEFCPADDIIADATAASNYDSYQWQVLSNSGDILYVTDFINGSATIFNVRQQLFNNGTPLASGSCYTLKLILQGNCKTEITKTFCISASSINLSTSDQPFCEGEPISISTNGQADWSYNWSNGESGTGLSSISPNASLSTSTYSVTATSTAGCSVTGNLSVVVHPSPNTAPELEPTTFTYYTNPHETVEFTVYSTDHHNEKTYLTNSNLPGIATFTPLGAQHQYGTFSWTPTEVDYGAHEFTVNVTDDNVCGMLSKTYTFRIEILCPLCPLCVSYEGNTPTNNPLPPLTEAAKCIEAGLTEEVVVGDDPVEFVAGESITLGNFFVDGPFFAQIDGPSCAETCGNCCENWTGFTYDEPYTYSTFVPENSIEDHERNRWTLNDSSNTYCAFNANGYRLRVYEYNQDNLIYEREIEYDYCCPFVGANTETGLEYTEISWDGYLLNGNRANDAHYRIIVNLYACDNETVEIFAPDVWLHGNGKSMISDDSNNSYLESEFSKQNHHLNEGTLQSDYVEFTIYPSPSREIINVSTTHSGTIEIYDSQGKLYYSNSILNNINGINVSNWSNGVYFVILKHHNGIEQTKFIKI